MSAARSVLDDLRWDETPANRDHCDRQLSCYEGWKKKIVNHSRVATVVEIDGQIGVACLE